MSFFFCFVHFINILLDVKTGYGFDRSYGWTYLNKNFINESYWAQFIVGVKLNGSETIFFQIALFQYVTQHFNSNHINFSKR